MPEVKEKAEKKDKSQDHLFRAGHTACPGCGQSLAVRLVLRASGRDVIKDICKSDGREFKTHQETV